MIIALILNFIVSFLAMILSPIPTVTVASVPFVGSFIQTYLTLAVHYFNTAITIVPYLALPWFIFTHVIIPFELTLLLLKVFFGSRTPFNTA